MGWLHVAWRGGALLLLLLTGVALSLVLRLLEQPFAGPRRPLSAHVTQWVCRAVFALLGIRHRITGQPLAGPGAVVSNHVSWLDIFALNARKRVHFVAKSEVARWPGIGFLARLVGTVFIDRDRRQARAQTALFEARLKSGQRLLFFPEGTSSDGLQVLPFKPTLFEAFFVPDLRPLMRIQAVTLCYTAPPGQDPRFYGWWGDMEFGGHLLRVLAAAPQGAVRVVYHPPVAAADFPDRKALAAHLERLVRGAMPPDRPHV